MPKRRSAAIIAIIIMACLACLFFALNTSGSKTTHTTSKAFKTQAEKIAFLRKYLALPAEIRAAEFRIDYWDNSRGLPGPSDWDIRAAVKMPKDAIGAWTQGFTEVEGKDIVLNWWRALPLEDRLWARSSRPKFYRRDGHNTCLVVFFDEGIVLERFSTM